MASESVGLLDQPDQAAQASQPGLRWEWRTFGGHFGNAEERISKFTPSRPKESDEIYFLSPGGDNVKVRDGLMDIKVLREVNSCGLEHWAPIIKAPFPLSGEEAATVAEALRIPASDLPRESYSLAALIEDLARRAKGVRVVNVHKRRVCYTVEGCIAELSEIKANALPIRTLAIESEDPDAIVRAIETLGLRGYTNTNYVRALAAVIDEAPERYAVIDVGTNSIKFHVAAREIDGIWNTVADDADVTRLGEGLSETGRISDAALDRTAVAIGKMAAEAKEAGVRAIVAVGTAGLRVATNAQEAVNEILERTGVHIEVLPGYEEARLAYLAAATALGPMAGTTVVFDTGGGSSQFTFGHGSQIDERFSLDVGAARYTEKFGLNRAASRTAVQEAMDAVSSDLSRLDDRQSPDLLVGMGGAITNLTAVALGLAVYDPDLVQGATMTVDEIDRQIELYRSSDAEGRRAIIGLQPKRAEVILAGACIVRTVMRKLRKNVLTVSDRGLRHGVLAERFGG